ncbi:MAG: UDP-N-acetylmuramoyl-L-alanyl-D-glutamate--2,6-diaminopimelate ligase [Acidimicrobiales bacterium]
MTGAGITLDRLAGEIGGDLAGPPETVDTIAYDSRCATHGSLFACVPGDTVDGHDFAAGAVANGASALLVERPLDIDVPQIVVRDSRAAMGPAAAAIYHHPERDVTVLGVTGTNGKTTVTQMLGSMLTKLGRSVEVLGTLSGVRTTPEAPDLFAKLASMRASGVRHLALEVSSHALQLHRVNGMKFEVSAFTNLSQDHLDFHASMEEYFEAKASLFEPELTKRAVINADDRHGSTLLERRPDARPYSVADAADLSLDGPTSHFKWHGRPVTLQLAGLHNVSNAVCAATILDELAFGADDVADALGAIDPVPGRMEWVSLGQPFRVVVDYSHTPDSLRVALAACRTAAAPAASVVVVFGCGGDRDQAKRPLMGRVAADLADRVVVTSDNPRGEDPVRIIDQIVAGIRTEDHVVIEPDRQAAIDAAIAMAEEGDVVLLAGKGHETTQTIGDNVIDFDDRMAAMTALGKAGW